MREVTRIFFTIFTFLSRSHGQYYTPLEIDNHPCQPENLKRAQSYTCTSTGEIVCQTGWQEPANPNDRDPMNPCCEPICHECIHGTCVSPNMCACEVGWEGRVCDTCIPLPGCRHGHCVYALECICNPGYGGGFCDIPECGECSNGYCSNPNECVCFDGWKGDNCTECIPLAGCVKGQCADHPHTCSCESEWEGALCDMPICNPPCEHGECVVAEDGEHICKCETGWSNVDCNQCVPYWECPNQLNDACSLPNECHCSDDALDPKGLCSPLNTVRRQSLTMNNQPEFSVSKVYPSQIVATEDSTSKKSL